MVLSPVCRRRRLRAVLRSRTLRGVYGPRAYAHKATPLGNSTRVNEMFLYGQSACCNFLICVHARMHACVHSCVCSASASAADVAGVSDAVLSRA